MRRLSTKLLHEGHVVASRDLADLGRGKGGGGGDKRGKHSELHEASMSPAPSNKGGTRMRDWMDPLLSDNLPKWDSCIQPHLA